MLKFFQENSYSCCRIRNLCRESSRTYK